MSNWNASNYRKQKAVRQATRPAQWFTNPETEQQFFIRPIGASALVLAGYLPSALQETAVESWKQHGIEPEGEKQLAGMSGRTTEEADRANRASARMVYEACVIPTLTAIGETPESIQERASKNCELAFANDEEWKAASDEEKLQRASEVVLPMEELEESDVKFILKQSYSYAGEVPMKGGQVMNIADLKSVRKKPGRRARTGTSG